MTAIATEESDEVEDPQELVDGFHKDSGALFYFCALILPTSGSIGNDGRRILD